MDIAVISDIGLMRKKNEDNYLINRQKGVFAVCDGMGGHKGGEVASRIAIDAIADYFNNSPVAEPVQMLNESILLANKLIWQKGQEHPKWYEMGTTVTAALLENNQLTIANVGDSSLFIIRNNNIRKITRDHTLAEQMAADGLLEYDEMHNSTYNHVLTRALGVQEEVMIDNFTEELLPGDYILICSDGLSDMVDESAILNIVKSSNDVNIITRELLDYALVKGGYDNITAILLHV